MDFLLNLFPAAYAAPAGVNTQAQTMSTLFMFLILLFGMYFFAIRPQHKRQKEHADILSNIHDGDEVLTTGGITGVIQAVDDNFVQLTIAENVTIKLQKAAIIKAYPKGTL